ncbi:hypothetical protein EYC80_005995 [Monilinia laxa]|uniref:Uncharacterized protein n=1 Tax=Monilinia laxa TaxID=61186 RepID=A0A5N6KFS6_MONLA|nr:hypothetical protein EYC80_005995 [Monilinia laxa]
MPLHCLLIFRGWGVKRRNVISTFRNHPARSLAVIHVFQCSRSCFCFLRSKLLQKNDYHKTIRSLYLTSAGE